MSFLKIGQATIVVGLGSVDLGAVQHDNVGGLLFAQALKLQTQLLTSKRGTKFSRTRRSNDSESRTDQAVSSTSSTQVTLVSEPEVQNQHMSSPESDELLNYRIALIDYQTERAAGEYATSIYNWMRELEQKAPELRVSDPHYIDGHPVVTTEIREIVVDWLMSIARKTFSMEAETM